MKYLDALIKAKDKGRNIVIPDIKCFSPKEGELMGDRDPVEYARLLCEAGAPVLSVVTEPKEFHGSIELLKRISKVVSVPVLRKDFIHTREELIETKEAGASAILLMCSCLERDEIKRLYREALEVGLDPFVETHVAEDFDIVRELGAKLVGINNRNILELERDNGNVTHTIGLSSLAPDDAFLVTESSIEDPDQVRMAIQAGADAALVGTAILKAEHTKEFYKMMTRKTSLKICGLMNEDDIEKCLSCGVERIGLVTEYPVPVPWNIDRAKAKELRSKIPAGYKAVMVAGGERENILELAEYVMPDICQIHYFMKKEDLKYTADRLHEMGISVISKYPLDGCEADDIRDEEIIRLIEESGADELLVDPRDQHNAQQQDLKADISLVKKLRKISPIPVILAGGVNCENTRSQVEETGVLMVDVMSKSETEPGNKDIELIKALVEGISF